LRHPSARAYTPPVSDSNGDQLIADQSAKALMQARWILTPGQRGAKKILDRYDEHRRAANRMAPNGSGKFTMTRQWRLVSRSG
jgi:hypothetical protein